MQSSLRRITTGVVTFLLTVLTAVTGYVLAGWDLIDAVYMVVITVFGVGYGEVRALTTPELKAFTMLVIVAGFFSLTYIVSGVVQLITEGEIHRALNIQRMTQEIAHLEKHVIICGYGRIGQMVARRLADERQPFVVIDNNSERLEQAREQGYLVYQGNATDEQVLCDVQISRARSLATVLPDDAANVFITLTARELSPTLMILARGEMPSTERKLRLAGANHVVLPATISALRIAHMIIHPAAVDFLSQTDGHHSLNEMLAELDIQLSELIVQPDSSLIGGTVGDIEVRGKGTFITVALRRANGEVLIHPSRDSYLAQGDTIILMGHQGDMPQFMQRHLIKSKMRYRGARHL
ncbi:potassium channel protein [Pseudanabaena sp. FACHB-2040]|uniref:potassium channel family protein n=1 Tax=Pseudanabaena sp. FACHB-2040 TaxID=2692859 RepID=UPI001688F864|nr:potassium channel protein [Pseudanabaena sp. FACHB-2040]MBD2258154.1 potassium channel protein [Pseudanabaena sp. FACHB-2040]